MVQRSPVSGGPSPLAEQVGEMSDSSSDSSSGSDDSSSSDSEAEENQNNTKGKHPTLSQDLNTACLKQQSHNFCPSRFGYCITGIFYRHLIFSILRAFNDSNKVTSFK